MYIYIVRRNVLFADLLRFGILRFRRMSIGRQQRFRMQMPVRVHGPFLRRKNQTVRAEPVQGPRRLHIAGRLGLPMQMLRVLDG